MKITSVIFDSYEFLKRRFFLILWISLVIYLFYDTFIFYKDGQQFYYLRRILGLGLCVSRGTATVLNLSCALVLLPFCKKLNQVLYRALSKLCPGLFFFWLERAKTFHMTVAITILLFGVMHSISHFVNLWNFSRGYDENRLEINFANYRNENPLLLLMSMAGVTGISMLLIILSMGLTSMRVIRRRIYNAFWYTHQLYLPFLLMLLIHPLRSKNRIIKSRSWLNSACINKRQSSECLYSITLLTVNNTYVWSIMLTGLSDIFDKCSGVLKEEVLEENDTSLNPSHVENWTSNSVIYTTRYNTPKFVPIKSKHWLWMVAPLSCFSIDLLWRIFSRNRAKVDIINVSHMPGRTISLTLSTPHEQFAVRMGQYVLLQCLQISLLEWHPFTVVKVPTSSHREFVVWIRLKGDWTEALEKLLLEKGYKELGILVDGPFSSPMEGVTQSEVAICVAAGVGITPFVAVLYDMLLNPRSRLPRRIHLMWIVRHEHEIAWLAELANRTITQLRYANRPDRLHLEFYVTNTPGSIKNAENKVQNAMTHMVVVNEKAGFTNVITTGTRVMTDDEKATLLTPNRKRVTVNGKRRDNPMINIDNNYEIARPYPLLGCRVRRGKPYWDRVFGYWVHLYPGDRLNLYCCGPKKLVKLLRSKCKSTSRNTKTKFTFIHEGFS